MSRELKFRCWNNCLREYIPEEEMLENFREYMNEDHLCIEQYTGLKDKNGKEIYEGDIIEETISIDDNITVRYKVYWDEDTLCWGICGCHSYDFNLHNELWETNLSREIIGNINENPELLEG